MLKPRKKFSKKELREDKFVTATFKTQAYIQENRNTVFGVTAAIMILFLSIIWYMNYNENSKLASGTLVTEGSILIDQGQRTKGINKFKEAVTKYSDESAAFAAYSLGKEYLSQDHADSSIFYFTFAVDNSNSADLKGPSYMNLASAYFVLGNLEEAESNFESAYNDAPFSELEAEALYNLALVQKQLEKNDKARENFEKVIEDFPDTRFVERAKINLKIL